MADKTLPVLKPSAGIPDTWVTTDNGASWGAP